jgi:hypothetical protein
MKNENLLFRVLKIIAWIGISFFFVKISFGQTLKIKQIRQATQKINMFKNYQKVVIDDAELFLGHATDNGATLTALYKGQCLKKIIEWVGGSNLVVNNEYYFENNKLIFVYALKSSYRFNYTNQEFNYKKLDVVFEGRYYFERDKIVDIITSKKQFSKNNNQVAIDFLKTSKKYIELYKGKR